MALYIFFTFLHYILHCITYLLTCLLIGSVGIIKSISVQKTTMTTLKANNGDSSCGGETEPAESDDYYVKCMAEILDAFPKSGPPDYPTRLSEHLYIGNQDNADDVHLLSALDITHVLNMAGTRIFDLTRFSSVQLSSVTEFMYLAKLFQHISQQWAELARYRQCGNCQGVQPRSSRLQAVSFE